MVCIRLVLICFYRKYSRLKFVSIPESGFHLHNYHQRQGASKTTTNLQHPPRYAGCTRTTVCESVLSGLSRICVRDVLVVPSDSRLEKFDTEEVLSGSMFSEFSDSQRVGSVAVAEAVRPVRVLVLAGVALTALPATVLPERCTEVRLLWESQ